MQLPETSASYFTPAMCLLVGVGMLILKAVPLGLAFIAAGMGAWVFQKILASQPVHRTVPVTHGHQRQLRYR